MENTNKIKHLEMIESIIERMARNSFQLKGWAMTIVAAVLALNTKPVNLNFMIIVSTPILVFWILDSFYLQQERRYRVLYSNVIKKEENNVDFNLNTRENTYSDSEAKKICFLNCMFSITEVIFYVPVAVSLIFLFVLGKNA